MSSRRTATALLIILATGCSGGTASPFQELYDHAAHVTVISPTAGRCETGTGLPLRVALRVDGWRGEPEIEDSPYAFSTTFEPGSHTAYMYYNAFGCSSPFYYLENPFRRDEHRLIVVTNAGVVGTEEVSTSQLPYPPPRDGRTIYFFNAVMSDASVGLDEDGDGNADSPIPVRHRELSQLERASDDEVMVVAEVEGSIVSAIATGVFEDTIGNTPWSIDARACVIYMASSGPDIACVLFTLGGIQHWASDPAERL